MYRKQYEKKIYFFQNPCKQMHKYCILSLIHICLCDLTDFEDFRYRFKTMKVSKIMYYHRLLLFIIQNPVRYK